MVFYGLQLATLATFKKSEVVFVFKKTAQTCFLDRQNSESKPEILDRNKAVASAFFDKNCSTLLFLNNKKGTLNC